MKRYFKFNMPAFICVMLLISMNFTKSHAQENSNVQEPPIPVYMIYSNIEDSLKGAYERSYQNLDSAYIVTVKKYDTLQQQVQRSSAESSTHFIWLYMLVALLGAMNIVLIFSIFRVRKDLAQMKHLEHRQLLLTSEFSAMPQPPPPLQGELLNQDETKTQAPESPRKPRTVRTRVKKQK